MEYFFMETRRKGTHSCSSMLSAILFVGVTVLWKSTSGSDTEGCPPPESIAPHCICKNLGNGPMMLCSNIMNAEELIPPIKTSDSYDMFSLGIIDSTLLYIPSKIFLNTKYQKIRFANSQIMSLANRDLAFEGLEDRLEEIRATDAQYITTWDWSQLRNHRRLELIDIHMIQMYSLDQRFPSLPSLRFLGISKAEISFLHPEAFRGLENLKHLSLNDNEITEMSRKMFPDPAKSLFYIDLSNNLLISLPEDMFKNMPSLNELNLANNKLVTLKEETFLWPLEHLQTLRLADNEFRCDCRLRWMVHIRKPMWFDGDCTYPENLKKLPLKYISDAVLWC